MSKEMTGQHYVYTSTTISLDKTFNTIQQKYKSFFFKVFFLNGRLLCELGWFMAIFEIKLTLPIDLLLDCKKNIKML